jgi:branched-chain amino acid transport system substrate-binding protein
MRNRPGTLTVAGLAASVVLVAAACSNSPGNAVTTTTTTIIAPGPSRGTVPSPTGTPGVSPTKIVVGALATESGTLAGQFASVVNGAQAYFDYVNANGGVDGRKIDLAYNLDDAGSTTDDTTQARNLVEQDHVFAVVGVGTPFFSAASYFAATGTPVFGYVVTQDWNNRPSLFGAYGSYLTFGGAQPIPIYVAHQLHAKSVAVVAYNIAASSEDACAAVAQGLRQGGVHVGFEDLAFPYSGNPTADVLKMKAAGVDLFVSCIAAADNLSFAKVMHEYGMASVHQVWSNGYDRSYLQQAPQDMVGVIYLLQHVPFEAATQFPGRYPAMETYLEVMKKYQPQYEYNDLAFQGYLNAAQFVQGLRESAAAGLPLTQKNLVDTINKETAFSAGLTQPVNWTYAHTAVNPIGCESFVEVMPGDKLRVVFYQKNDEVFVCGNPKSQIVPPPAGTP